MLAVFVGLRIPVGYIVLAAVALLVLGYYLGKRK